ncbi:MAG TPA: TetR/AcrR family transcriptional regulator [Coleofasciculaceae cyanobacterium]
MTNHRPPGRPRRVDSENKIDTAVSILENARRLFAERGFAAVSINDIVSAAEISKPTLYYYYPDKESLYAEVLLVIIEQTSVYFSPMLEQPVPLRSKLAMLTEGFFENSPISLSSLLRDVSQHLGDGSSKRIRDLYHERIYRPFESVLQDGINAGELKPVKNIRLLAELFLTMLDWLTLRFALHDGPPLDSKEKAYQVVALFMEGAGTVV